MKPDYNLKRKIDVDPSHYERKRLNSSEEQMKIVDLNNVCLDKIFRFLDLQSLFNVATANAYLRPAAAYVYKREFGHQKVKIWPKPSALTTNTNGEAAFIQFENRIEVNDLRTSLRFLRYFGESIIDLNISYRELNRFDHIHQYITEYCAQSLSRITFTWIPNAYIDFFDKPLVGVKSIGVCYGHLGHQFASFPAWFPNVSRLSLFRAKMDDRYSAVFFQLLDHLYFQFNRRLGLSETNACNLLIANRHIKSLFIDVESQLHVTLLNKILNMIEYHSMVSKLTVRTSEWDLPKDGPLPYPHVNVLDIQRLVDEHPGLVELDLNFCKFTANDVLRMAQKLKSLMEFRFLTDDPTIEATMDTGKYSMQFRRHHRWVTLKRQP